MPPACPTSASGGVVDFEGSGGGGLTPWALITGIGTNTQIGASADCTYICPQHFFLTSCGAGLGIDNRLELPYAHQTFDLSHLDLADIATHPDQHGLYLALRQLLSGA
jgi:hypothetical protein